MDEERVSRPHTHPLQAPTAARDVEVPEQRSSSAPPAASEPATVPEPELLAPRVMSLARLTLAVIFGMLLFGLVVSFIMTRS